MMTTDSKRLGLYLHIPFCPRKCLYCDFHSAVADRALQAAYVDALAAALAAKAPAAEGFTVDTVYIGGGTPTVLPVLDLSHLLRVVRERYTLSPDAEVTVECNPATEVEGLFEGLLAAGCNRLSIGLQSANDRELALLGRAHSFADFERTFAAARRAGFQNISVDVMFGIPDGTAESLNTTLQAVIAHAPDHVSAYGLRVEEGTPFFAMRDRLKIADDDAAADMQLQISKTLCEAGYLHYEVSNYAREGRASRHNLRYWTCLPYLGFGAGAHSYFEGERYETPRSTRSFIAAVREGRFADLEVGRTAICGKEALDEYVMLHMRLFCGIDKQQFKNRFGVDFGEVYGSTDRLVQGGFLIDDKMHIAFTEKGMYVSNAILSDWLDFGR